MKIANSLTKLLTGLAGVIALGAAAFFLFKFFVEGLPETQRTAERTVGSLSE